MTLEDRAQQAFAQPDAPAILFLFDPEGDYREESETWAAEDVRRVTVGEGTFGLKHKLETDWAEEPVLLYFSRPRPTGNELASFHLADLLLANQELYIDAQAEFIDAYGFERHQERLIARYFKSDLKYKNRKEFLAGVLTPAALTEKRLKQGLALFHLRQFKLASTSPSLNRLVAGVMEKALDEKAFADYKDQCEPRDLEETVCRAFQNVLHTGMPALELPHVRTAAQQAKYNFLTHQFDQIHPEDPYAKLRLSSQPDLTRLIGFINEWQQVDALASGPEATLSELAPEVDEAQLIDVYGPEAPFGFAPEAIQRRRLEEAAAQVGDRPGDLQPLLAQLKREADHPDTIAAMALEHMARYYELATQYAPFNFGSAQEVLDVYVNELYACDRHYRKAVEAFQEVGKRSTYHKGILHEAYRSFLKHYQHAFISPLNAYWQQRLVEEPDGLRGLDISRQRAFYQEHIGTVDRKVAVIISDALRYEVADELRTALLKDPRKEVALAPMMAGIPSTTALGMASLLPHNKLSLNDDAFLVDGESSSGTRNRARALQRYQPEARAVRFDDVRDLSMDEGRELVKGSSLVYIYHDHIDAVGDNPTSEKRLVSAVKDTVDELRYLVRTLNNWNIRDVVITADHGFLYTEDEVTDDMLEAFPKAKGMVRRNNRYIIASEFEANATGYEMALSETSDIDTDLRVRVPRAVNRYRLQGSGRHFAHGGASLQELLVPVLTIRKAREQKAQKVSVQLVTEQRSIRGSSLKVTFLQVDAVSSTRKPRDVRVGLYNDQKELVSDEVEIRFDYTSSNPTQRQEVSILTLLQKANTLTSCKLLVFDADDINKLNPIISQRFAIKRAITPDF